MKNRNGAIIAVRAAVLAAAVIAMASAAPISASAGAVSVPTLDPCNSIENACLAAGFINGDWGAGKGLWFDCVDPIFQGQTTASGATKPLPEVDPTIVAACKSENPSFGDRQVGAIPPARAALTQTGLVFPDLNMGVRVTNWDDLANAAHGIVAMKAWQSAVDGPITQDIIANFQGNLRQAEARGMIVIGYAFGVGGVDGATQADALLALFHMGTPGQPVPGHILALDLERSPDGPTMTDAEAAAFVNRVYTVTGRYPILYASEAVSRPGVLGKCPRWVAAWGSTPPSASIWQFTDGVLGPKPHSFPGVGQCDINRLIVTYGALRTMVGI
jgi:lysozyme